jgi:hypothetical protein
MEEQKHQPDWYIDDKGDEITALEYETEATWVKDSQKKLDGLVTQLHVLRERLAQATSDTEKERLRADPAGRQVYSNYSNLLKAYNSRVAKLKTFHAKPAANHGKFVCP